MTAWFHASRPHHRGWLEPLARLLDLRACGCWESPAPASTPARVELLVTSGGPCPRLRAAARVVRVGRRSPLPGEYRVDLWCAPNPGAAVAIRDAGYEGEIRVTGLPDRTALSHVSTWRKPRPTLFVATSEAAPERILAMTAALRRLEHDVDLVLHPDPLQWAGNVEAWRQLLAAASGQDGVIPIPPTASHLLSTLAQADLLVTDEREWVESYLVLDRPVIFAGPRAAALARAMPEIAEPIGTGGLGAAVAAALDHPAERRAARRRMAARVCGPENAAERIVAAVRGTPAPVQ